MLCIPLRSGWLWVRATPEVNAPAVVPGSDALRVDPAMLPVESAVSSGREIDEVVATHCHWDVDRVARQVGAPAESLPCAFRRMSLARTCVLASASRTCIRSVTSRAAGVTTRISVTACVQAAFQSGELEFIVRCTSRVMWSGHLG